MTEGPLEAVTSALGRLLSEIHGYRFTRLRTAVAQGAATFPVETTHGWPTAGVAISSGTRYAYTGKTTNTLTGVSWDDAGVETVGAKTALDPGTKVVDYSRTFSAYDFIRAQLFVGTATGDRLSSLGRDLGVKRPPGLSDDAVFRRVVAALAYNPRGTIYGIQIALEAFFGAGNFRVYEDFPTHRNTVFIELLNGIGLAVTAEGNSYFMRRENVLLDAGLTDMTVQGEDVLVVQGVTLADETWGETLTQLPSDYTEVRYPGDGGIDVWTFVGTDADDFTFDSVLGLLTEDADDGIATYQHTARIRPESEARIGMSVFIPTDLSATASHGRQWAMCIRDGERDIAVGLIKSGSDVNVGFLDTSAGTFIGSPYAMSDDTMHDLELRKDGSLVELYVDGVRRLVGAAGDFDSSTVNEFRFGILAASPIPTSIRVTELRFWAHTPIDYWNTRDGAAFTDPSAPTELDTDVGLLLPEHVGHAIRTYGADFEKDNGEWKIEAVLDADRALLTGFTKTDAFTEAASPSRISVAGGKLPFKYPRDIGKRVEILSGPQAGVYEIGSVLDPLTGVAYSGTTEEISNRVGIVTPPGGGFQTHAELLWRLIPNFGVESSLSWELAGTGTQTGQDLELQTAVVLDVPGGYEVIMTVTYATVRSAHLVPSADVLNDPTGAWIPFYLPTDPLGPFATFLDDLTVAGVIPEVILSP